jgi:hypothetical protein
MTEQPSIVFVEHVLWEPGDEWTELVDQLGERFARSSPLDADAVRAAGPLHAQLTQLQMWADEANVDLDRELGRWLDEHLSMHVRPAPAVTRAVRALAGTGRVHLVSALPARAAESITRHAGCWRSVAELHAAVRDEIALEAIVTELSPATVIAADPTPLPAGVRATPLLDATAR